MKRFLSEVKDLVPETIWTYQEVGHTQDAKKEVLKILGGTDAPMTPKPVFLSSNEFFGSQVNPAIIILDSIAGTGPRSYGT